MDYRIGDCREVLRGLEAGSAQCCVTSPPYYGLRDYGVAGQIGLEPTPDEYVAEMVAVFREVRRVLRDDGTLWLNIGDSYAASGTVGGPPSRNSTLRGNGHVGGGPKMHVNGGVKRRHADGVKPKDLLGIPWMLAFALRADGWFLRSDIIWHKPNPMPESVRDRPTSAHEHVFLLTKGPKYYYDAAAIAEPAVADHPSGNGFKRGARETYKDANGARGSDEQWTDVGGTRNVRNVWTIATRPYSGAHFATMPPDLAERCIKAGTKPGDTVLDPLGGAGTTALVAERLDRTSLLIDLNPEYKAMAEKRLFDDWLKGQPPAVRKLFG